MSERGTLIPEKAAVPSAQIPGGIERMMADETGLRFDEFLEYVQPLAELPDPKEDEDAFAEAWNGLIDRLEKATAEELIAFTRERITLAIQSKQLSKARRLARFLRMDDEVKRINAAWLDDVYQRFKAAKERPERREISQEHSLGDHQGIANDPRSKEIRESNFLDEIQEVYRFKNKIRSGAALACAGDVLRRSKINLRDLDPELFSQVHADAVKHIEQIARANSFGTEGDAQKARSLIEEYINLGIFDFEQDEALIDRFTQKS